MNDACVFCKIIKRELPATLIAETDDLLVIKDRAPKAEIHYLIIPKFHTNDIRDMSDEQYAIGGKIFAMARHLSLSLPEPGDFVLHMNNGYCVGQRVFHAHIHFLAGQHLSVML
jgi:histidine triad (HIT) family protein